jgi:hypothetical protein
MYEIIKLYDPTETVTLSAKYSRESRDFAWRSLSFLGDNQRVSQNFIQCILSVIDNEYVLGVIR